MKATNHPSDKMTIKNNNGDLLLEIDAEGVQSIKFKDGNEITGEDISSAIGKADTLPAVTSADEGKALVIDSEGKIVPGEAGTTVVANPTLAGTESALEGLQVGETKYKVGGNTGVELFNETVTVVSTPVSLSLYEDAFNYPISKWNAKVNGYPMSYDLDSGFMRYIDMEAQKAYIIMSTTPYEYAFICVDLENNPVAGDYELEIYGEYFPGSGIVHISNLECNRTLAEIEYLQTRGYLDCVVNPEGKSAIECVLTLGTSFAATFIAIAGTSVGFTTYTLDSNDEITTTNKSSNITIS